MSFDTVYITPSGGYYYTDVDWFETFSSDPWLLTYVQNIGWLRWLFAPWHIGGNGKKDVNHIIANDIFFVLNRFWKLLIYPEIWAIFKMLPFLVGFFLFLFLLTAMFAGSAYYISTMLATVAAFVMVAFNIWLLWIGFGKSCHRYGIPLIHCFRHLCVVFLKSIKK